MVHVPNELSAAFANDLQVLTRRSDEALALLPAIVRLDGVPGGGTLDELASCAHALVGTAALLGLATVAGPARRLEQEAEAAGREVAELQRIAERLAQRLASLPEAWRDVLDRARLTLGRSDPADAPMTPVFAFIDGDDDPPADSAPAAFAFIDLDPVPEPEPTAVAVPVEAVATIHLAAFRQEAAALLATADASLAGLDEGRDSAAVFLSLMRTYHTLKGSANTVGLTALGEALHDLEDRVEAIARGGAPATAANIAALGAVQEGVRSFLATGGDRRAVGDIAAAVRRLSPATVSPPATVLSPAPPVAEPLADVDGTDETPPVPAAEAAGDGTAREVRVSPRSLDRLLDLSGELVTSRARLDRRLADIDRVTRELARWRRRTVPGLRRLVRTVARNGVARRGPQPADGTAAAVGLPVGGIDLDRYDETVILARRLEEYDDRMASIETDLRRLGREAGAETGTLGSLATGLHREAAAVRLIPFGHLVPRLRLAVREAADRLAREVRFISDGADQAIDVTVADAVSSALLHLVRNAVDHGIRPAAERIAGGRPAGGEIRLAARTVGGALVITVSDDGPGLDPVAIRRRAAELGLPGAERADPAELIFRAGFSTREQAGDVSGRGIGLDAARAGITAIGGQLTVAALPGEGCRFAVRLPPQAALADLVTVLIGGQRLALPDAVCERIETIAPGQQEIIAGEERIPVVAAARLLGLAPAPTPVVVVIAAGGRRLALAVDRVRPPRVLLVDDSIAVRKVGERFLLEAGCLVETAIDGAEALERLRSAQIPFDAVISDLEMPRTNGYRLLATVRGDSRLRHLPLAIMSSRRGADHRAEAARLGADAYLTKPFSAADLTDFVVAAAGVVVAS